MSSDSGLLWPRHEVLQLINPAIPQPGKSLSQGLAVEAVRQLAKMQSHDGSVSFQQWYSVARDLLRWNDHFIRLFWDMLHIAMWYRQKSEWSQHSDFVHFEYLVVFLIMHVTTVPRPSSPTRGQHHNFDCLWPPSNLDSANTNASTSSNSSAVISPPTSPVLAHRKQHIIGGVGSTAPLSPRNSPRSGGGSTSPRKQLSPRLNTAVSFVRSHTQHLTVLREKIPLLLYALSLQDSVSSEHKEEYSGGSDSATVSHKRPAPQGDDSSGTRREDSLLFHATMSSSALDALGLLVGGGITQKQEAALLSSLHHAEDSSEEHSSSGRQVGKSPPAHNAPSSSSSGSSLRCAHVVEWIVGRLKLNDVLYPPSPVFGSMSPTSSSSGGSSPRSPGADIGVIHHPNSISEFTSPGSPTSSSSSSGGGGGGGGMSCDSSSSSTIPALQAGLPQRQVMNIDSPHSRDPTVIHGSNCSAFHVLKVHGNGNFSSDEHDSQSHMKSLGHLNDDDNDLELLEDDSDEMGMMRHQGGRNGRGEGRSGGQGTGLVVQERYGPVLLSACAHTNLYLLSPYTFASVSACSDSEIVLGAVAGVVVVCGCERVQLTVACRKLILWNCRDCDIKIATLTPTIVSGDCRGLTFGPFNTTYRHLRTHLRLARLEALIVASKSTLANVDSNCWNEIYDINTCADLDSPTPRDRSSSEDSGVGGDLFSLHNKNSSSSGSSYQMHAYPTMSSGLSSLPPPPDSVLTIQNPEKYSFLPIPYMSEFQPQEMCPMMTPAAYLESYMRKKQASVSVRQGIQAALHEQKVEKDIDCESTFNKMLSHQFLEWLAKTGKAPSLLDLIRLDADDKNNQSESEEITREFGSTTLANNSW